MVGRCVVPALLEIFLVVLHASAGGQQAAQQASQDKPKSQFLRLVRDKDGTPATLETAIVRCAPPAGKRGPTVDLVAAVHVADRTYYDQLNKEFQAYDAVLYELVAPKGAPVAKGSKQSGSLITVLQKGMKDVLQLEYQLDIIDYTRTNMVHADMSPEQLAQAMRDRGESAWSMLLRLFEYTLARQGQAAGGSSDLNLVLALFDKDRSLALKRAMAAQFEDIEAALAAVEGPQGVTILSGRNQAALAVLREQVAAGKQKIAIFYGAAHMPDFQQRLGNQLGLVPVSTRWIAAWEMRSKPGAVAPKSPR